MSQACIEMSSQRGEVGSTLVEFALCCSILFSMIFGIFEVSLGAYTHFMVAFAAREGTRFAAVRGSTCTGATFTTACPATVTDIQDHVLNLGYVAVNQAAMSVNVSSYSTVGAAACARFCNDPGNLVQVTVRYSYPFSVPFVPKSTWVTTSSSQEVISQ